MRIEPALLIVCAGKSYMVVGELVATTTTVYGAVAGRRAGTIVIVAAELGSKLFGGEWQYDNMKLSLMGESNTTSYKTQ